MRLRQPLPRKSAWISSTKANHPFRYLERNNCSQVTRTLPFPKTRRHFRELFRKVSGSSTEIAAGPVSVQALCKPARNSSPNGKDFSAATAKERGCPWLRTRRKDSQVTPGEPVMPCFELFRSFRVDSAFFQADRPQWPEAPFHGDHDVTAASRPVKAMLNGIAFSMPVSNMPGDTVSPRRWKTAVFPCFVLMGCDIGVPANYRGTRNVRERSVPGRSIFL
jgi:hypothetical protein